MIQFIKNLAPRLVFQILIILQLFDLHLGHLQSAAWPARYLRWCIFIYLTSAQLISFEIDCMFLSSEKIIHKYGPFELGSQV